MSTGISFPSYILKMIDIERGDVPRSRFLIRILEEKYQKTTQRKNNSSDNRLENPSDELRSKY